MHFDSDWIDAYIRELDDQVEESRRSFEELARIVGMTVEEYDADVTADDPGRDGDDR